MTEKFENYNGNQVLMAARGLVTAAANLMKHKGEDVYAALRHLEPTNPEAVSFILWLNPETYDYYERHKDY